MRKERNYQMRGKTAYAMVVMMASILFAGFIYDNFREKFVFALIIAVLATITAYGYLLIDFDNLDRDFARDIYDIEDELDK